MEVSSQINVPAVLSPGKDIPVPKRCEKKEKFCLCRESNTGLPSYSPSLRRKIMVCAIVAQILQDLACISNYLAMAYRTKIYYVSKVTL
jgi:hypothetical protein